MAEIKKSYPKKKFTISAVLKRSPVSYITMLSRET
jgi:hypothetical protein